MNIVSKEDIINKPFELNDTVLYYRWSPTIRKDIVDIGIITNCIGEENAKNIQINGTYRYYGDILFILNEKGLEKQKKLFKVQDLKI